MEEMLSEVDPKVQLSLSSSPPTRQSGSGTTAGSQLGSPTSLPATFPAPTYHREGSRGGNPSYGGSADRATLHQLNKKCSRCHGTFTIPKMLDCLHTICQLCLEKERVGNKIRCSQCSQDTPLPLGGIASLPFDSAVSNILEIAPLEDASLGCAGCKSKESSAVARCFDCANFLCSNCVMAHQFMHSFDGHRLFKLGEPQSTNSGSQVPQDKSVTCLRHRSEPLCYFCLSCGLPICKECALFDHPEAMHELKALSEAAPWHVEGLSRIMEDGWVMSRDLREALKTLDQVSSRLQAQYQRAEGEMADIFHFYCAMLEERRQETLRELENICSGKMMAPDFVEQKVQDMVERIHQVCAFVQKLTPTSTNTEILFLKLLLEKKLQGFLSLHPEPALHCMDLEFVPNYQATQVAVHNTFGYIKEDASTEGAQRQPPFTQSSGDLDPADTLHQNGHHPPPLKSPSERKPLYMRFSSENNLGTFSTSHADVNTCAKWSSAAAEVFQNGSNFGASQVVPAPPPPTALASLSFECLAGTGAGLSPLRSQIKRRRIIYHCKFGKFGTMEGQFTEPSGVAVNAQNDVIVADSNNHCIQIFDRKGRFKFRFGEYGKRDGQLRCPNRVAVVRQSGEIVVTERSPIHQIQIFNQYGQFMHKFGAEILQHPRGVAVDPKGRVVIVESKVMRVIIFDKNGSVLQTFDCSKHLEFPNSLVVNSHQEIFISDNRAHCVKVFNYDGMFLRKIGGEGVTNYPIAVCMNQGGDILVADNYGKFNLTVFTQDGQLINALESKVKHAQCFDVALMDDGCVVLASKDYRLYVYRYMRQPAPSGPAGPGGF